MPEGSQTSPIVGPLRATGSFVGVVAVGRGTTWRATGGLLGEIHAIHKQIFPGNPHLLGEVRELFGGPLAVEWLLSNGRHLSTPAVMYSIVLPFDYKGIVAYCDFSEPLETDEIIEVVSLLRGSPERIIRNAPASSQLVGGCSGSSGQSIRDIIEVRLGHRSLAVPVVYARDFEPALYTAEELLNLFPGELTAIRTLSIRQADLLKRSHIERWLEDDAHPFVYGVTFFSPVCTLEFHPASTATAAAREGLSLARHHLQEWSFLTGLLVTIALARSAMESDSKELDALLETERGDRFLGGLKTLRRMSSHRRAIATRLNIYSNIELTRREYMDEILSQARRAFGLVGLYESLRHKLEDLAQLPQLSR